MDRCLLVNKNPSTSLSETRLRKFADSAAQKRACLALSHNEMTAWAFIRYLDLSARPLLAQSTWSLRFERWSMNIHRTQSESVWTVVQRITTFAIGSMAGLMEQSPPSPS